MSAPLTANQVPSALLFALRLTEVSRWGIVSTSRQQSVGEHSYRVCLIAVALYDYMMDGTQHNSFERQEVAMLSMLHDVMEILSGDIPSTFKRTLEGMYPGLHEVVLSKAAGERPDTAKLYELASSAERGARNSGVEAIVKVADLLERILYINVYGTNDPLRKQVLAFTQEDLDTKLNDYKIRYLNMNWERANAFQELLLEHNYL